MTPFSLRTPDRILFGRGCRDGVADLTLGFGRRVAVVRGRSVAWADVLVSELAGAGAETRVLHSRGEPTLPQLEAALAEIRPFAPDVVVAVGGGATVDLGKALAGLLPSDTPAIAHLEVVGDGLPLAARPCPFIAVPTTAGTGAEATKNAVIAVPGKGVKVSLRDEGMLPALAVVDPALTDDSPRALTLASGLDAVTQLIEPYVSCRANPLTDSLCRDLIAPAIAALHRLMIAEDPQARDVLARASFTSGVVLANSGLGIVHGLAGVIGGRTGAAHGALCGRLLPAGLAVNRDALLRADRPADRIDDVLAWIGTALGGPDPLAALTAFMNDNGLPSLKTMGVTPEDSDEIASQAARASSTKANPIVLSQERVARILELTA